MRILCGYSLKFLCPVTLLGTLVCLSLVERSDGDVSALDDAAKLNLVLSCSSPASINTQLVFRAVVQKDDRPVMDVKYRYQFWDDTSSKSIPHYVLSEGPAVYTQLYSKVSVGLYTMTVQVFSANESYIVPLLTGTMDFQLTDKLNGDLVIQSGSEVLENPAVVQSNDDTTFRLQLRDSFVNIKKTKFRWTITGPDSFLYSSPKDSFTQKFINIGSYKVSLDVSIVTEIAKNQTAVVKGQFSRDFRVENMIYDMILESSSPAVLNSNITFRAIVTAAGEPMTSDTQYRFEWWDNHGILNLPKFTTSLSPAVFEKAYSGVIGNFGMTVSLFYKNMSIFQQPLVKKTLPFFLTEYMSGDILVEQSFKRIEEPALISSNIITLLSPDIHDDVTIVNGTYNWSITGPRNVTSNQTKPKHTFTILGVYSAILNMALNTTTESGFVVQKAEFLRMLYVKDPVMMLGFDGVTKIPLASKLVGNITCHGSPPFTICHSITKSDSSGHVPTCIHTDSPLCNVALNYKFNTSGDYTLNMNVRNEISQQERATSIHVYSPSGVVAASVSVPIILLIIACLIILFLLIKLRQPRHVEVADFNFHGHSLNTPSLSVKIGQKFSSVRDRINQRIFPSRGRYSKVADGYGSTDRDLPSLASSYDEDA